jgi:hypothetical protein
LYVTAVASTPARRIESSTERNESKRDEGTEEGGDAGGVVDLLRSEAAASSEEAEEEEEDDESAALLSAAERSSEDETPPRLVAAAAFRVDDPSDEPAFAEDSFPEEDELPEDPSEDFAVFALVLRVPGALRRVL